MFSEKGTSFKTVWTTSLWWVMLFQSTLFHEPSEKARKCGRRTKEVSSAEFKGCYRVARNKDMSLLKCNRILQQVDYKSPQEKSDFKNNYRSSRSLWEDKKKLLVKIPHGKQHHGAEITHCHQLPIWCSFQKKKGTEHRLNCVVNKRSLSPSSTYLGPTSPAKRPTLNCTTGKFDWTKGGKG